MKYLFSLLMIITVFLFMTGCTQIIPPAQPEVTGTSAPVTYTITTTTIPAVSTSAPLYGNVIVIQKMTFVPAQITISSGTLARWVNEDTVTHSVMFPEADKIDSIVLSPGQAFTVRFDNPGVYNYSDSIYPSMQGAIVVT
jgi:plastocyanin